jgi:hypothetical protein
MPCSHHRETVAKCRDKCRWCVSVSVGKCVCTIGALPRSWAQSPHANAQPTKNKKLDRPFSLARPRDQSIELSAFPKSWGDGTGHPDSQPLQAPSPLDRVLNAKRRSLLKPQAFGRGKIGPVNASMRSHEVAVVACGASLLRIASNCKP